jgi:hypothetical protein
MLEQLSRMNSSTQVSGNTLNAGFLWEPNGFSMELIALREGFSPGMIW